MTAAWAAAAMLDALRAEVARDLDDEHADRQMIVERVTDKLSFISAAFHTVAGHTNEDDAESYCRTCGAWVGIFHGLEGWRHFRGDPAPGGQRELYHPGHEAAVAWCVPPPGRALSPAQVRALHHALTDAVAYRLDRADGGCAYCEDNPARACADHTADVGLALTYRQLAATLVCALPASARKAGDGRPCDDRRPGRAGRHCLPAAFRPSL